jgi:carbonic anhydrase/SulP family sulfate permease
MPRTKLFTAETFPRDLAAGFSVFLVALPLCLGIALASDAPPLSGLIAGIVGGVVVGIASRSHTSVSGPAAGLTTIVAAQIASLGSYEAFMAALVVAGLLQVVAGTARLGFLAEFVPNNVVKGLLAAIGLILILKQIPHVLGHDTDPEGEMSFRQPDRENTFSELVEIIGDLHWGATVVGLSSFALLMFWHRIGPLARSKVPSPVFVVLIGLGLNSLFTLLGGPWQIGPSHLIQIPDMTGSTMSLWRPPNPAKWLDGAVLFAAVQIALVASLETLLNLKAVDKLDPKQRTSPANRELVAQGLGNTLCGCLGGLPITSVIIRSSVNINSGGRTRLAAILHGLFLLLAVVAVPTLLNRIPLASVAAILLATGVKLADPAMILAIWRSGWRQFGPFLATVVFILFTDLLFGVLLGLLVGIAFILYGNLSRPVKITAERHLGGHLVRVSLSDQVSFLGRATLARALNEVVPGEHVLIDARTTHYIDADILDLIKDFQDVTAPARGVRLGLQGFEGRFGLRDEVFDVDTANRDLQSRLSPDDVLRLLKEGNERFCDGRRLPRDLGREVAATAKGQFPLAVVLSCIDSRSPAELVFDLGVGDIFSVRIAGNVAREKVLASMEYACAVAGTKLVVVMGHTQCGAVTAAVTFFQSRKSAAEATGCQHLDVLIDSIQKAIDPADLPPRHEFDEAVNLVARNNVLRVVKSIPEQSRTLADLVRDGRIRIVGVMYDVRTGRVEFLEESPAPRSPYVDRVDVVG